MPTIPTKKGMTLKLTNVLMRETGALGEEEITKAATLFDSYVANMKFNRYGPVILKNTVNGDGVYVHIISQIRETPSSVDEPFQFAESIVEENCIMVRFVGPERMLPIAQNKGAIIAYEEGIALNGVTYTAIKEKKDGQISADIFFCTE